MEMELIWKRLTINLSFSLGLSARHRQRQALNKRHGGAVAA
jgi:hypothetical protein